MKFIVTINIWCAFLCVCFDLSGQERVLVYTHNGKGYVHENIEASVDALKNICAELQLEVMVSDDPSFFDEHTLSQFICVIFCNTNNEAFSSDDQRDKFVNYIQRGGGFMGIHSASGSERDWPWYWSLLGGKFVYHPPLQEFSIKVIDTIHQATSFLGDTWIWEDECYMLNHLNPDIHILLAADLSTIKDDKDRDYPNEAFGKYMPISWCHQFDGGRQFYTALGHEAKYYSDPEFVAHLRGGLKWVIQKD